MTDLLYDLDRTGLLHERAIKLSFYIKNNLEFNELNTILITNFE
jgi:hypothetical protein